MKINLKIDFLKWKLLLLSNVNAANQGCYVTFVNISEDAELTVNGEKISIEKETNTAEIIGKILSKGSKKCLIKSNGVTKEFEIYTDKDFTGEENLFLREESGIYRLGQCYEDMTLGEIHKKTEETEKKFEKYLELIGGTVTGNLWLKKGFNVSYHTAGSGQAGYIKIANIKIGGQYVNAPIIFEVLRRGDTDVTKIMIRFANINNNDPGISSFEYENRIQVGIYLTKVTTGSWDLYIQKSESYDCVTIVDIKNSLSYMSNVIITLTDVFSTSASGTKAVNRCDTGWTNVAYGNGISTYSGYPQGAVRRCGKFVELNAVVTNSTEWTEHNSILTIPTGFRPSHYKHFVCQGSGSNRFLLTVQGDGKCLASRYSNNTTMSNKVTKGAWLCLHGTWITNE